MENAQNISKMSKFEKGYVVGVLVTAAFVLADKYIGGRIKHNSLPTEIRLYDSNKDGILDQSEAQEFSQKYRFVPRESDLVKKAE